MAVKIKLARLGKIREPFYRVVVADARTARNGRAIELIGQYHPKAEPSRIDIDSDRVQYWLSVGAQPTEPVLALLKVTGDWQKFHGLPGAEGTLQTQPEKVDKRARYEAALAALGGADDDTDGATTPKRKSARKPAKAAEPAKGSAKAPAKDSPKDSAAGEAETATTGAAPGATEDQAGSAPAPAADAAADAAADDTAQTADKNAADKNAPGKGGPEKDATDKDGPEKQADEATAPAASDSQKAE